MFENSIKMYLRIFSRYFIEIIEIFVLAIYIIRILEMIVYEYAFTRNVSKFLSSGQISNSEGRN